MTDYKNLHPPNHDFLFGLLGAVSADKRQVDQHTYIVRQDMVIPENCISYSKNYFIKTLDAGALYK